MYIDLGEMLGYIAIFIGICLGIAVLVLLIIALIHLTKTIKKVNVLLDNNVVSIEKTTQRIPQLVDSIDNTVISVGGITEGVRELFFDKKHSNDAASSIVNMVESVASIVISFLAKKK